MKILQEPLSDDLKKKIYSGFREYAIQEMGLDGIGEPIAFVAIENSEYIGAIVVQPFCGALHIKYVWVHNDKRGKGIGKRLLNTALAYGQEANYSFAFVETMSFQALGFYQKMDFTLEYTRHGYIDGTAFHYLRKDLAQGLEFKQLNEIDMADVIELMNHPLVRRHMPLLKGKFDKAKYKSFIAAKEKMWEEKGYGPWAFTLNGIFIGWGGLQPVDNDVEIALVLNPNYWGQGKVIYDKILKYAFENQDLESVIVLFPPSRIRVKGILRLGFKADGEYEFSGKRYIRYRLHASEMYKKG